MVGSQQTLLLLLRYGLGLLSSPIYKEEFFTKTGYDPQKKLYLIAVQLFGNDRPFIGDVWTLMLNEEGGTRDINY